jgi:hypothetical protein
VPGTARIAAIGFLRAEKAAFYFAILRQFIRWSGSQVPGLQNR